METESSLSGPRRVLFLGFTLPSRLAEERRWDRFAPQTQNFANAFLEALTTAGLAPHLVSVLPVRDFPLDRVVLARGTRFESERDGAVGVLLPFVNLTGIKHISRFLSAAVYLRRVAQEADTLVVHGVNSSLLLAAVCVRSRVRASAVILTDPPAVMLAKDGPLRRMAKRIDGALIRLLASRFDGAISLASKLAQDLGAKKCLVMEGIVNLERVPVETAQAPASPQAPLLAAYAGGLSDDYGVSALVEACETAGIRLAVIGTGPLEPWLRMRSGLGRVDFRGSLPPRDVAGFLLDADVLVSPRPTETSLAERSFPSKIIEYMATGRVVISTQIPTLPDSYRQHLVIASSGSVDDLAAALLRVERWSPEERREFGRAAREFILDWASPASQGFRIRCYLDSLATSRGHSGDAGANHE